MFNFLICNFSPIEIKSHSSSHYYLQCCTFYWPLIWLSRVLKKFHCKLKDSNLMNDNGHSLKEKSTVHCCLLMGCKQDWHCLLCIIILNASAPVGHSFLDKIRQHRRAKRQSQVSSSDMEIIVQMLTTRRFQRMTMCQSAHGKSVCLSWLTISYRKGFQEQSCMATIAGKQDTADCCSIVVCSWWCSCWLSQPYNSDVPFLHQQYWHTLRWSTQ